jgi:release factor glutamine methyltransferase
MTDCSSDALDVARANAAGIGRAGANVRLAHGDWFDALPADLRGQLALVVSNPPYVPVDDEDLEPEVRDWEPALALFGGADGLDAIRRLVADAARWLRPAGWLVIEIGSSHGRAVRGLLREAGFEEVSINPDLSGRDRVAAARRAAAAALDGSASDQALWAGEQSLLA